MEIEALVRKMKNICNDLLCFVESTEDFDVEYKALIEIFEKEDILQSKDEILLIFQLISKIVDNHNRSPDFFDKLEKVIIYLINDHPLPISDLTTDYFKYNKRLLLLLLTKGLILPDETFLKKFLQIKSNSNESQQLFYLYPGVKQFIEEKDQKEIEKLILEQFGDELSIFEEKCQIGENDSYICSLIRSDSIEEFVSYVNRTNFYLSNKIKSSIYETNSLLIGKEPTLIEYAAFFGSIQIIQYLKYNNVPLTKSMWLYGVHSKNAELIHFLEENEITADGSIYTYNLYRDVFIESIKCHHNDISNYIKDNLLDLKGNQDIFSLLSHFFNLINCICGSLNFFYFPDEIVSLISDPKNESGFSLSQLCFSLKTVTIPSSVTSIGYGAFKWCSLLKEIIIPSSVTSIGNNAFSGCSSLTQILIPSSVTSFGKNIFEGVKTLDIKGDMKNFPSRLFIRCSSITQISIPSSVTTIDFYAFTGCSSLTQITIPSSVTSIKDYDFTGCLSLKQVLFQIPSSVTSIEYSSFKGCSSLKQILIPSSVIKIGKFAFAECLSLEQVSFESPSSLASIECNAFKKCQSLTEIKIPSSVNSIGDNAFEANTNIIHVDH